MQDERFAKWASRSLVGHVVLAQLVFGLPLWGFFVWTRFQAGALTIRALVVATLIAVLAGASLAAILWYTMSWPRIRRMRAGK